ncbi:IucA/IucC family siderophore biosynthesis protein [Paenibacillus sp. OK003]|uniref:IucA/IucC family protein n=1 Tax=Paenibacillus sp. OK003 TaxID=1884380 RepID=UPI0008C147D1|nr:IucA/IucC family protein [Paenibacillus sp. OK003]SEK27602.1 Siderophore synthetase component [Paenibacillus sp. OK003]
MTKDNVTIDPFQQTVHPSLVSPSGIAHQEMLSRIMNAYLRETEQHDPYVRIATRPDLSLVIELPRTGQRIYGNLLHRSAAGHHVYGDTFHIAESDEAQPDGWREVSFEQITTLLLDEISSVEPNPEARMLKRGELEQMVYNSLEHMTSYLEHALNAGSPVTLDFRYLEQALLCGHPFHPTPKSLEGFSSSDSRAYSPEFGVSFPLSCFAVAPELVLEDWLDTVDYGSEAPWVPAEMAEAAWKHLSLESKRYVLLPCHPWQAAYLRTLEPVKSLLQQGTLIDLGTTGPSVYPTSSVRTVWNPKEGCFYKLSLHIRITNFIRENNEEQLLRTLDASRIVQQIQDRWTSEKFQILLEKGYRSLKVPEIPSSTQDALISGFSMILREAPESCRSASGAPYVVASLMEVLPGETEPLLFRAVRESLQSTSSPDRVHDARVQTDWYEWLRQYLELSMVPLVELYAETGISLEAHVQNSMLRLENGMPATFVVRDLEGISVNRALAEQQGWIDQVVNANSPVLYTEEESRHRLKYYFFVNHLSHVVQRLAYYTGQQEQPYWRVVRNTLEELRKKTAESSHINEVIRDLLTTETLPAKANLLSRFHQRGETPLYVNIPNPMR